MALPDLKTLLASPGPLPFSGFVFDAMKRISAYAPHGHVLDLEIAQWKKAIVGTLSPSLHITAESRDSNWSYGTYAWVLLATLISRNSSESDPFPECLKYKVCCSCTPVADMSWFQIQDTLHGMSMRWRDLHAEFGHKILQKGTSALQHRTAELLVSYEIPADALQRCSNFFVFCMKYFQYRTLFPVLELPEVPDSAPYQAIYDKYINTRRFRKKLLGTYFILSPRISDLAHGFEDYSAETILQTGRSEKWNQIAQTRAYNDTLEQLMQYAVFADAIRLNAFDLWFKHTFNLGFKDHFLILQKDVVNNRHKLNANVLPLLVYAHDGISLFYNGKLSKPLDCTRAFQIWFYFVKKYHDGAVFNNIMVEEPA